jgi:hypothetical protein
MAKHPKAHLNEESEQDYCGPIPTLDIDAVMDVISLNLFAFETCETMFAEDSISSIYQDEIRAGLSLYLNSLRDRNYKLKSIWLASTRSEPESTVVTDDKYLHRG